MAINGLAAAARRRGRSDFSKLALFIACVILLGAWFTILPPLVFAANCGLTQEKFDALKSVQNDYSLSYSERIKAELAIRKDLLSQTVDCAINEADSARTNLNKISVADSEVKNAQSRIADQISQAIQYYQLQKNRINDLGIQGSKDFARDLASWRGGNYEPAAKNAYNLGIWVGNQNIIQVGKNRLDQIGQSVNLLKIVDNKEAQELWGKAKSNFDDAVGWNEKAKDSLISFGLPDDTLNMIKSSLDSLSSAYQNFFDIFSAIDKALHP